MKPEKPTWTTNEKLWLVFAIVSFPVWGTILVALALFWLAFMYPFHNQPAYHPRHK